LLDEERLGFLEDVQNVLDIFVLDLLFDSAENFVWNWKVFGNF
jgi:hypothetical protein